MTDFALGFREWTGRGMVSNLPRRTVVEHRDEWWYSSMKNSSRTPVGLALALISTPYDGYAFPSLAFQDDGTVFRRCTHISI
jgi:hypothetical protein